MKYLKTYDAIKGITFKEWLKKHTLYINTTTIDCYNQNLTDLDGIQEFKNLKELWCGKNKLTSLNLEGLDKLEELYCYYNKLTELNLKGLYNIKELHCKNNKLTSLNLEGLYNLKDLYCNDNKLTELNLEGLDKLEYLNCRNNNLPYIDLDGYWEWFAKEYPDKLEARKFNF